MKNVTNKVKSALRRIKNSTLPAEYSFSVDSPGRTHLADKTVTIEGWLIPLAASSRIVLRALNAGKIIPITYGAPRPDVANAHPDLPRQVALASGFSAAFEYENGIVDLELDLGKGFKRIYSFAVQYSPEKLVETVYNPDLAARMAEHEILLENKSAYFYEPERSAAYKRHKDDPKLMAFYLPQFHPFPENDTAWGKGFTEWTNVASAKPRFQGHLQPILPADLGFYDLRLESVLEDQISLAKKHGIYGFCFYYYWFSGKRLLEGPLDTFLRRTEWDFNFTICWANENWTKRWDGRESDVIVAQKYQEDDPERFIRDVEPILSDPRYMQHEGKPILLVYRAQHMKNPKHYVETWRKYYRQKFNQELYLVSVMSFDDSDPREAGFDIALDFAPQTTFFKNETFPGNKYPMMAVKDKLIDIDFDGNVADYRKIALNPRQYDAFKFPSIKSVTPSWDNDARKKGSGFVMQMSNPDVYSKWLDETLAVETSRNDSPLVFINAWNEWAEGAMLEPSAHYGHATLNRTSEVLAKYSKDSANAHNLPMFSVTKSPEASTAVLVHMYYTELWPEISNRLHKLPVGTFDLYVTIMRSDAHISDEIKRSFPSANVILVPNRGRDVLPFVHLARRLDAHGYKYLLKLHSKKTVHRSDGASWFAELLESLVPSTAGVERIMQALEGGAGMVGPEGHYLSYEHFMAGNEVRITQMLGQIGMQNEGEKLLGNVRGKGYFGGTMFWSRFDAIRPLLNAYLMPEDFESEAGQTNVTLGHAIERLLGLLPELTGTSTFQSGKSGLREVGASDALAEYPYAASTKN